MSSHRASAIRTALATTILVLTVATIPVVAAEDALDTSTSFVAGEIILPVDTPPLTDGTIVITIEDTRRADAPSIILSSLTMDASGAESPAPFALSIIPAALDALGGFGPLDITIEVRIEAPDGSLLYVNDTAIAAVTPTGPITDLEIPVVAAEAD